MTGLMKLGLVLVKWSAGALLVGAAANADPGMFGALVSD